MGSQSLYTRHDEVPRLSSRAGKLEAHFYNNVQTALRRIDSQIRLTIPKLKHLDLILQKDAWIIVDKVLNDYPIAAWTDFEVQGRESLHEPIHCEIRYFHYAASMVLRQTLEAMEMILGEELASDDAQVISIPSKKD